MAVPTFKEIKTYHALGLYPKRFHPYGVTWISSKKFRNFATNFELDNGILYLLDNGQKIEILEDDLKKNTAFKDVHCLKHINIKDTCAKLENKYFWFGMEKDIANWISSCETCKAIQKKQQENCELVLSDHCYACNVKEIVDFSEVDETRFPLRPDLNVGNAISYAKRHHKILQSVTTKQAIQINSSSWDHDYIADKLTMRRKLHSFIQEDQCQLPMAAVPESILLEEEVAARTAQETQWKSIRFNVDYDFGFLPVLEESSFVPLLGLERVVEMLNEIRKNKPTFVPPHSDVLQRCANCQTDVTPSWHRSSTDQIVCKQCHGDTLRERNLESTKLAFHDYNRRFTSNFALIKREMLKENIKVDELKKKNDARQSALSRVTKMRKLAFFKANVVTKTLLRNKGLKPTISNSEELFTQKIRRMMSSPSQETSNSQSDPDCLVQALTKKQSLQEYLEWRLKQHKSHLLKQMNLPPNLTKVSKQSGHKLQKDAIKKRYQISINDLQKLTKQLNSSKIEKLRREVQAASNIQTSLERQLQLRKSQTQVSLQPVKLRALSKEKVVVNTTKIS